jgi:hypothetical protein
MLKVETDKGLFSILRKVFLSFENISARKT